MELVIMRHMVVRFNIFKVFHSLVYKVKKTFLGILCENPSETYNSFIHIQAGWNGCPAHDFSYTLSFGERPRWLSLDFCATHRLSSSTHLHKCA